MQIVIDLQGAQTESRFRGIGRYSLSLALAIARNADDHDIWLVLNAAFPETIQEIRQEFEGLIPNERIKVFDNPLPVMEAHPENAWKARAAEKIRENFIATIRPDIVLVSSLFEGYVDNATTSIGSFTTGENVAVILYDLIPLLNPGTYLPLDNQKHYYHRKIDSLNKAGLLLAISEYSRNSAIESLGLTPSKVTNISTAVEPCFKPIHITTEEAYAFTRKYGITRKMVLYVSGGFDARKNLGNLITAYSLLPAQLRSEHQLVIASKIDDTKRQQLMKQCKRAGLNDDELVLTGYLPNEDLLKIYCLATLFVFPSLYEGFGLPVLEAMACGAAVLGSNNTSLPEVIGCDDALFDGSSPAAIAEKIERLLYDHDLRKQLQNHGLQQAAKFSWDESAKCALRAMEMQFSSLSKPKINHSIKQRLAFISPLPPERTGIADYCVELLQHLTNHYDIELITNQSELKLPVELRELPHRSIEWFKANASSYTRILYHFGNSPFHTHMLALLESFPGVVVLHDFFLSSMLAYEEIINNKPLMWTQALLTSHGYKALQSRFDSNGFEYAKNYYPCNLAVLQNANKIIVHSEFSKQLAENWYGKGSADNWEVIPLLRVPSPKSERQRARKALGISEDAFVICSFGLVDPTKLSHRLLNAWLASELSKDKKCQLFFVGSNHGGDYGLNIINTIDKNNYQNKIKVTGWNEKTVYDQYLQAADVGVQLRTMSRGETSAAVLDCMNYGLATIANANGSMAEIPDNIIWMLPDEFTDEALTNALETLWKDKKLLTQYAENARQYTYTKHNPTICAEQYAKAIESTYSEMLPRQESLINAIGASIEPSVSDQDLMLVAQAVANSNNPKPVLNQLLFDVTSIMKNDLKTGIERVVRSQLLELMNNPPGEFRIEPVYLTKEGGTWHYRYARDYTLKILGLTQSVNIPNSAVEIQLGDIFYGADFAPYEIIEAAQAGLFTKLHALGVKLNVLVYDLLPILHPEFFPAGADQTHTAWLSEVVKFSDQVIGISQAVADELHNWLEKNPPSRRLPLAIHAAPLGADISASIPTTGLPKHADEFLNSLRKSKSFLMVGTIEPRKGHLQTIEAFEQLWKEGHAVKLVVIGKEGWKPLPNQDRRTIPVIVDKLTHHPELGKRLFWLQDASDEYLQKIYSACTCLLAVSEGEGFGLPVIEAAHHKLPIIARDIPVFREVAGTHAHYFSGQSSNILADEITKWLRLNIEGRAPSSNDIRWNTWQQNVQNLTSIILGNESNRIWAPQMIRQKAVDEHLFRIHAARVDMVKTLLPKGDMILDLGGANSPLYKMGYPHPFKKLTLIDLPPDDRHEYYKDIHVNDEGAAGEVVIRYTDMTSLADIQDNSLDFVWSGQSIEHVPHDKGIRMCKEVFRVLKKGGAFCLDTPNRLLTKIHTHSIGGGFIHPEHHIEYLPEQLKQMLIDAGFLIKAALGICEMPETVATNNFHYSDFMFGKKITENINSAYIQFFHCIKAS